MKLEEIYADHGGIYERGTERFIADCTVGHALVGDEAERVEIAVEIARRVNAHDALVEAAKVALEALRPIRPEGNDLVRALTTALEKAHKEGEAQ